MTDREVLDEYVTIARRLMPVDGVSFMLVDIDDLTPDERRLMAESLRQFREKAGGAPSPTLDELTALVETLLQNQGALWNRNDPRTHTERESARDAARTALLTRLASLTGGARSVTDEDVLRAERCYRARGEFFGCDDNDSTSTDAMQRVLEDFVSRHETTGRGASND